MNERINERYMFKTSKTSLWLRGNICKQVSDKELVFTVYEEC